MVVDSLDISDKKFAILDLHGTLTPVMSIWRFVLEGLGLWREYEHLVKRLRDGELTYRYCCETITHDLSGTSLKKIEEIMSELPLTDGVIDFTNRLKDMDISIWILTSGLGHMGEVLRRRMPIDRIIGNWYEVDEVGNLTGGLRFNVDMGKKGEVLAGIFEEEGIEGRDCLAMGDTKNDIPVFEMSGLSIAVSPKTERLEEIADMVIELEDFRELQKIFRG